MSEPCDICGRAEMRRLLEVCLIGERSAWVHCCGACGFRQVRPRLTNHDIRQLYPSDYFDAESPVGYADYAREFQRRQREAYFLRKWLGQLGSSGRLLEVGCALGFLLAGLRCSGWQLAGVDASAFAAHYASTRYDLDVTCATLEELALPDGAFDVVVQKDLLEHVADPRHHLNETCRVLRSGGWLRLVTPNGEANLRPLFGASGAPPGTLPVLDQGHLSFFGRRHLLRLFDECGFRCCRMKTIGIRRGLTALGCLPGQARFVRHVPNRKQGEPMLEPEGVGRLGPASRYRELAERIDREIERHQSRLKGWVPYYYYHRALKQLDALPAWCEVGYDFDCLLQKA